MTTSRPHHTFTDVLRPAWVRLAVVASGYFLLGQLAQLLAIPPGFSTPVWPAAGLALFAALFGGIAGLAGILLGSYITNLLIALGGGADLLVGSTHSLAIGIGAGAAAQAFAGAWLLQRYLELPTRLENQRDVAVLLGAGTLSCLINASSSVGLLVLHGLLAVPDVMANWITWLVGDALGVVLITPLLMVMALPESECSPVRKRTVLLPTALALVFVTGLFVLARDYVADRREQQFTKLVADKPRLLEEGLNSTTSIVATLAQVGSRFQTDQTLDQDKLASGLFEAYPYVSAIGWAPRVVAGQASAANRASPSLAVRVRTQAEAYPLSWLKSRHTDQPYVNTPLGEFRFVLQTMDEAEKLRQATATRPFKLRHYGGFGALILLPIFADDVAQHPLGFFMVSVNLNGLIQRLLPDHARAGLDIWIYDPQTDADKRTLYGAAPSRNGLSVTNQVLLVDRSLRVVFTPNHQFDVQHRSWDIWFGLIGGFAFCSLFMMFLMLITGRTETVSRLVLERTQELLESQQRNALILENAGDGIYGIDADGNTTFANRRACDILGFNLEGMLGRNQHKLIHHSYPDGSEYPVEHCNIYRSLREGIPTFSDAEVFWHKDGHAVPVEYVSTPFTADDGSSGAVVVFRDITNRINAEAERDQLIDNLTSKNQELARYTYVASHDLKEPVRGILAYTQLVLRRSGESLDDESRQHLDFVVNSAQHLQALLEDLEVHSEAEEHNERLQRVDLNQLLMQTQGKLNESITSSKTLLSAGSLPVIQGNFHRIGRVLQNLIGNAIKFRSPHRDPVIQVGATAEGDFTRIHIRDNGIGVSSRELERIFEPFVRLHTREEYSGSGLGLSICKKIIEDSGGKIWMESVVGEGSTCYFTLPLADAE